MMHAVYMLLLFHVLTCFGGNALRTEIINGKKTKQKSMLYMASVQDKKSHLCGGFLISENFVLTAAHCYRDRLSVVLGTHNLKKVDDETMRYGAVKKCKHPSYDGISKGNDIMLLKLSRNAHLGKKAIKPIQLPTQDMKLKEKKKCCVAGWGLTRTNGEVVNDLRQVDVPIIDRNKCTKAWRQLPANVICAGGYDTKKGFCQGDSGGPLVCNGKVAVGVASYNNNSYCDYPDVPNVYTEISKFLPWIKEILKKQSC